jgi:excisionase family DNA binding protein
MDTEKLLTVPEVAEILQVSPSTVYRRIKSGELPCIKLGHRQVRIKPEDLEAYIEAHRVVGKQAESQPEGEKWQNRR